MKEYAEGRKNAAKELIENKVNSDCVAMALHQYPFTVAP